MHVQRVIHAYVTNNRILYTQHTHRFANNEIFCGRSCGLTRADRVRSEDIRNTVKVEENIADIISKMGLLWCGHLNKMGDEGLLLKIRKWLSEERRKKETAKPWIDTVLKAL